ncbi:hypothetical protein LSH36_219g01012 [Paralvinella palmiformis]|uniref:C2H2-type domain-containing protein n=1 Tax=Paralvinella palmiformis TaxID=53620 RepID=A0AAD9JN65_9ANNE|nr:hypothetical protein LSH36_219g01012 [Paralvinella palmiformis]
MSSTMGKLITGRRQRKESVRNKVPQVTKTVDIILPLELLYYCIQTISGKSQLHEVKATVLTKQSKKEIILNVWHNKDAVNLQLRDINDFPVLVDDDRWQCCIDYVCLPPSGQKQTIADSERDDAGIARRQSLNKSGNFQQIYNDVISASKDSKTGSDVCSEDLSSADFETTVGQVQCDKSSKEFQTAAKEEVNCISSENDVVKENSLAGKSRLKNSRLLCRKCRTSFSKIFGLKRHIVRKHSMLWGEYEDLYGTTDSVLARGVKSSETGVHEDRCHVESRVDATNQTRVEKASIKILPCPVCRNVLHHNSYLIPHVQHRHRDYTDLPHLQQLVKDNAEADNHSIISPEYKSGNQPEQSISDVCLECPKCHLNYTDRKTMLSHIQLSHKNCPDYSDILLKIEDMFYQKLKSNVEVGVVSRCDFCQVERIGRSIFKHLEICHASDPDYKNVHQQAQASYFQQLRRLRTERKRAYDNKVRTTGRIYPCRFCPKQFKYRPARSNHENFRCRGNPKRRQIFECYVCGFSTPKEDTFKMHKEKHANNPETANTCNHCSKAYKTRAGLTIHLRKVHNIFAKNPVVFLSCDQCGKKFYDRDHLNKHLVTHSDERPFQCELCGQQYKTAYAVTKHQKMVHFNKYTYHCDKCGHGVEKKQYLKKHVCGRTRRIQDQDVLPPRKQAAIRKKQKQVTFSKHVVQPQRSESGAHNLEATSSDVITLHMRSDGNVVVQEFVDSGIIANTFSAQSPASFIQTPYSTQPLTAELRQNGVIQTVEVLTETQDREPSSNSELKMKLGEMSVVGSGDYPDGQVVKSSNSNGCTIIHQMPSSSGEQQGQMITTEIPQHTVNEIQSLTQSAVIGCGFSQLDPVTQSSVHQAQLVQYPVNSLKDGDDQGKKEVGIIQIPVDYSQFFNLPSGSNGLNWASTPNTQSCITLPPITLASIAIDPGSGPNAMTPLPVVTMATDVAGGQTSLSSLSAPVDSSGEKLDTSVMDTSEEPTSSTEISLAVQNQVVMSDLLQLLPSAWSSASYSNNR